MRKVPEEEKENRRVWELSYWDSLIEGTFFHVGATTLKVERVSPHRTHIFAGGRRWLPRDVGLHQEATRDIRLRGEEIRKSLLVNKGGSYGK